VISFHRHHGLPCCREALGKKGSDHKMDSTTIREAYACKIAHHAVTKGGVIFFEFYFKIHMLIYAVPAKTSHGGK
jgi:hypothetical protein